MSEVFARYMLIIEVLEFRRLLAPSPRGLSETSLDALNPLLATLMSVRSKTAKTKSKKM